MKGKHDDRQAYSIRQPRSYCEPAWRIQHVDTRREHEDPADVAAPLPGEFHRGAWRGDGRRPAAGAKCPRGGRRYVEGGPDRLRRAGLRRGRERDQRRPGCQAHRHGRHLRGQSQREPRPDQADQARSGGRRRRALLRRLRRLPESDPKRRRRGDHRPHLPLSVHLPQGGGRRGQARLLRKATRSGRRGRKKRDRHLRRGQKEEPEHRLRPVLALSPRGKGDHETRVRRGDRRDRHHSGDLLRRALPLLRPQARVDRAGVAVPQLVPLQLAGRRPVSPAVDPQHRQGRLGHARRAAAEGLGRGRTRRATATCSTTRPSSTSTPTACACTASAATRSTPTTS